MFKDSDHEKKHKPLPPEVRYRDTVLRVADGLIISVANNRGLRLVEDNGVTLNPEPKVEASTPPRWQAPEVVASVYPEATAEPTAMQYEAPEAPVVQPEEVPVYPQSPELYKNIDMGQSQDNVVAENAQPMEESRPDINELLQNVQRIHDEAA